MRFNNNCHCRKCGLQVDYKNRIKVTTWEFVKDPQCSGSLGKTIEGFSLCRDCFKDFKHYYDNFF